MKYVLFTDPHLGIKKANDAYIQVFNTFIDEVCTHAEENNITKLIILGDFFDTRKSL
jgi:DNA repair exonuclease SbcCD nuclease subunit